MSTSIPAKVDTFNETVSTFGDRLGAAREAEGLTAVGLAEKLGLDVLKVEEWEIDADLPRANLVQLLAGLLNVSIIWLISGEGKRTGHVGDAIERPSAVSDVLTEVSSLMETLSRALDKLDRLENRLLEID